MSRWAVKDSQNSGQSCWVRLKAHLERNKNKFPEKYACCHLPSESGYFQEALSSEEDSDFWQITERRKREARHLTILHRVQVGDWGAERSLISQQEDCNHIA